MMIDPDRAAPDAEVYRADGSKVNLSAYWQSRPVVLTFLRHFGCQFCREFMGRLRSAYPEFVERRAAVIAVAQGTVPQSVHFGQTFRIPFPILTDPTRAAFRAFGLRDGVLDETLNPQIMGRMIGAAAQGTLPGLREHIRALRSSDGSSLKQLGGTFTIDAGGRLRYASVSSPIYNTPSIAELLEVLDQPVYAAPVLA